MRMAANSKIGAPGFDASSNTLYFFSPVKDTSMPFGSVETPPIPIAPLSAGVIRIVSSSYTD